MSTLFFFVACAIIILIVLSRIPGLEHLVKPLIDLAFTGLKAALENAFLWGIVLLKILMSAHSELLNHLFKRAEDIDPTVEIKKKM